MVLALYLPALMEIQGEGEPDYRFSASKEPLMRFFGLSRKQGSVLGVGLANPFLMTWEM